MEKEDTLEKLGNRLRHIRQQKNLSQEALAHRCGFDRTYISLLERAQRNPSYLNLKKLCNGLEIEISELLNGL